MNRVLQNTQVCTMPQQRKAKWQSSSWAHCPGFTKVEASKRLLENNNRKIVEFAYIRDQSQTCDHFNLALISHRFLQELISLSRNLNTVWLESTSAGSGGINLWIKLRNYPQNTFMLDPLIHQETHYQKQSIQINYQQFREQILKS